MAKADSLGAVLYALGANFAIFAAKSVAAWFTSSSSMLAEAVHSLADCGNQVLLHGLRRAKRPPTDERLLRVITLQLGETVMVSVKAVMRERHNAEAMVAAINDCEQAMRREFPQIQWLFFEPDIKD